MVINSTRRKFLKKIGLYSSFIALSNLLVTKGPQSKVKPKPRVVIIGYGIGGATCLEYLVNYSNYMEIVLIEQNNKTQTCPLSNLVLSDIISYKRIVHEFDYKRFKDIKFVNSYVNKVEPSRKAVVLNDDTKLYYDYLILSPGVGFKNDIEGYNYKDKEIVPHCWDGSKNIIDFKRRLDDLENNSTVIISSPDYPYRCPPAPYERACLLANFLQRKKKKFKVLILDSKDSFTKKENFQNEWKNIYKDSIEWVSRSKGGQVVYYDKRNKYVKTNSGEIFKGDFINIIPNQTTSDLISKSRLNSKDSWCSINPVTFELENFKNIFVVGDSINAWDMPKSAFSANSQAKVLSLNLINRILNKPFLDPVFLNTCYSFSTSRRAFSISSWYKLNKNKNKIVSLGSNTSSLNYSDGDYLRETKEAYGWYDSLVKSIYY